MLRELNVVEQKYQVVFEVLTVCRSLRWPSGSGFPPDRAPVGRSLPRERAHTRKTVQVSVGPDAYQVTVEASLTVTAARPSGRAIGRHQASNYG
jgi:hypothetical protein